MYSYGHLGEAKQAVNTTVICYHLIKLLQQKAAYLRIKQIQSNMSIYLESCLWALGKCKPNSHSIF